MWKEAVVAVWFKLLSGACLQGLRRKAVPLLTMQELRGRGVVVPTHYMGWMVRVTPRPRFTPWKRPPGTHWIGGWVGFRAGLDTEATGIILCLCWGSNPGRSVCSQTMYWLSYPAPLRMRTRYKTRVFNITQISAYFPAYREESRLMRLSSCLTPPINFWMPELTSTKLYTLGFTIYVELPNFTDSLGPQCTVWEAEGINITKC
jgi:hypothetical protein